MDEQSSTKDQPQLVTVKRINSVYKQNPSHSMPDDRIMPSNIDKHGSQNSLQSSITNIFRVNSSFYWFIQIKYFFYSSHLINEINDKILIMEKIWRKFKKKQKQNFQFNFLDFEMSLKWKSGQFSEIIIMVLSPINHHWIIAIVEKYKDYYLRLILRHFYFL